MPHCQSLLQSLRQQGYRITPQREMIVEAVAHSDYHLSAEEVFDRVQARARAINLATVYRTLELLVEQGLVSRVDLGGGRVVYATRRHGAHIHLVCRACGKVIDADNTLLGVLEGQIGKEYGFAADLQHITMNGLCQDCQAAVQN